MISKSNTIQDIKTGFQWVTVTYPKIHKYSAQSYQ